MLSPRDCISIDANQASALRNHDSRRLSRIKAGLGPESQDEKGNGPLHLVCHLSPHSSVSLDLLREVLSWDPTLDRSNALGWTPLNLAVLFLPAEAVDLLLKLGRPRFPRSIQDALRLAANYERGDVTAALLGLGNLGGDVLPCDDCLSFVNRVDRHARHLMELEGLAGRFLHLDRLVAKLDKIEGRVLGILAVSEDRTTLRSIARNPNTPTEILFFLAPQFPLPFFSNPVFEWLLLENPDRFLEMEGRFIRGILRVKNCPLSMIEWAVENGSDSERLAVIRRDDAGPQTLRAIAEKSKGKVRALALAKNPEASSEMLNSAVHVDVETDRLIAVHPNSGPDLLEKLGRSADRAVREALSRNPNTPESTKLELARGGVVVHRLGRS